MSRAPPYEWRISLGARGRANPCKTTALSIHSLLGRRRIVFALVDAWWTLRGAP
jgi:hypothetical protein